MSFSHQSRMHHNPLLKGTVIPTQIIPEPSAPPFDPTAEKRVIEPFSIVVDEARPLRYSDDFSEYSDPGNTGRRISSDINSNILQGYSDGSHIVRNDHVAAVQSNRTGVNISVEIDRKLQNSNRDRVDSFEIRSVPPYSTFDITEVTDHRYDATKEIIEKSQSSAKDGGYTFNEYKSIYEVSTPSGEYQMSEYKSIYDK